VFFSRKDPVDDLLAKLENGAGKGAGFLTSIIGKLARTEDPRAVEPLIRQLGSRAGSCRSAAAEGLAQLGEPSWHTAVYGDEDDLARLAAIPDPRVMIAIRRYFGWSSDEAENIALVGRTLLLHALVHDEPALADRIAHEERDIDFADKHGNTALNVACIKGLTQVAETLIARNANLDMANEWGQTALRNALAGGFTTIARQLMLAGARLDIADSGGLSPLFVACRLAQQELVDLLLERGAPMRLDELEKSNTPWSDRIVEDPGILERLAEKRIDVLVRTTSWLARHQGRRFRLDYFQHAIEEKDADPWQDGARVVAEGILEGRPGQLVDAGSEFSQLIPTCRLLDESIRADVGKRGVVKRYTLTLLD